MRRMTEIDWEAAGLLSGATYQRILDRGYKFVRVHPTAGSKLGDYSAGGLLELSKIRMLMQHGLKPVRK